MSKPSVSCLCLLQSAIVEMTGNTKAEDRAQLWSQSHKRIFFATPQTFRNDIVKGELVANAQGCVDPLDPFGLLAHVA